MDEYLVVEVWLYFASLLDECAKFCACSFVVRTLSVNDEDKRTTLVDLSLHISFEYVVAREVNDIEVDVVVGFDSLSFNLLR